MAALTTRTYDQIAEYIDAGERNFNLDSSGARANDGVLLYNATGFTSFANSGGLLPDLDGLSPEVLPLVQSVFGVYEALIDVDFVQTTSTGTDVDIYVRDLEKDKDTGNVLTDPDDFFDASGAWQTDGRPIYAGADSGSGARDWAYINIGETTHGAIPANPGDAVGSKLFFDALHEAGHALGLGHAGPYNFANPLYITDTSQQVAGRSSNLYLNDSYQASIMSYFSQSRNSEIDADFARPITPMIADLIALDQAYGLRADVFSGNTVWGRNSNITVAGYGDLEELADTNAFTIVDHGGWDRVDFSHFDADQRLDLHEEAISDIGGLTGNMVIARNTVIERGMTGGGDDVLIGNSANNVLDGGAGNDRIEGRAGNDWLYGQVGNDRLYAGHGTDRLYGGVGDDILVGDTGRDYLFGQGDDDTVLKAAGTGLADGGAGHDVLSFYYAPYSVLVDMNAGTATSTSLDITFGRFEEIYGSTHADQLYGSASNDTLQGWAGADILEGRDGADRLSGHDGVDRLDGGAGDDFLSGGSGNDIIKGGADNDVIIGDVGNDTIDGGTGVDLLDYTGASSRVVVYLGIEVPRFVGSDMGTDLILNVENLRGSEYNDYLFGDEMNNQLFGDLGRDRLYGRDGEDRLVGGWGKDILSGGNENDRLEGGEDADHLNGGTGADELVGGAGDDTFYFRTNDTGTLVDETADMIEDFGVGGDNIVLDIDTGHSVTSYGSDWLVAWHDEGLHEFLVKGIDPTDFIDIV